MRHWNPKQWLNQKVKCLKKVYVQKLASFMLSAIIKRKDVAQCGVCGGTNGTFFLRAPHKLEEASSRKNKVVSNIISTEDEMLVFVSAECHRISSPLNVLSSFSGLIILMVTITADSTVKAIINSNNIRQYISKRIITILHILMMNLIQHNCQATPN